MVVLEACSALEGLDRRRIERLSLRDSEENKSSLREGVRSRNPDEAGCAALVDCLREESNGWSREGRGGGGVEGNSARLSGGVGRPNV